MFYLSGILSHFSFVYFVCHFCLNPETSIDIGHCFPALALLNLLSGPLMELPAVITSMIEANVAIGRVKTFAK